MKFMGTFATLEGSEEEEEEEEKPRRTIAVAGAKEKRNRAVLWEEEEDDPNPAKIAQFSLERDQLLQFEANNGRNNDPSAKERASATMDEKPC